jgi:hypothetical protein
MTSDKTSISLPTDLAEYARSKGNASAYLASLIAADRRRAQLADLFARQGYTDDQAITTEGMDAMGERLAAIEDQRRRHTTQQAA